jgi:hypothetical protein
MAVVGVLAGLAAPTVFSAEAEVPGGNRFATVLRVRGDVAAQATAAASAKERKLRVGDLVYVGDNVRASSQGEVVLRTDDAGLVAVRPKSEFVAERFAANDKPTDGFTVRLITGSLRLISGWISHTNRAGSTVVTPTGTVGIRGTDHEPYVLSAEMAQATSSKEGTYDKVNRGGTTLTADDNALDIDVGKVGFVRAAKKGVKERGLLTLLMPVLVDRVPAFYVPGAFDAELDKLSQTAEQDNLRALELRRKSGVAEPQAPAQAIDCAAATAKTWVGQLDAAIARKDTRAVMALFAANATVRATVRTADGNTSTVDLDREELAQSTVAALKGLKDYQQRRITIDGKALNPACTRVGVSSVALEQGTQSGKPYRFESLEEYVLELRDGKWLASKAETTQK